MNRVEWTRAQAFKITRSKRVEQDTHKFIHIDSGWPLQFPCSLWAMLLLMCWVSVPYNKAAEPVMEVERAGFVQPGKEKSERV